MKVEKNKIIITGGSGFIGSYLLNDLLKIGVSNLLNIDIVSPINQSQEKFWQFCNILDYEKLKGIFLQFQPEIVIHLAARTDTDPENTLEDYRINVDGTENVLKAIKDCSSVKRVIITSTQFVNQYRGIPKHDEDYAPHTVYGESKVISEKLTREADLNCCWTIIRPTNIWGPNHPRYPTEFWYILKKGIYIHPGKRPVIRSYGYVGNVVDQIITILKSESSVVNRGVFYVGDAPINLYDWVNEFSLALNNKKVIVVPIMIVNLLAKLGDVLFFFNLRFPITSSRFRSMTESNSAPMEKTLELVGKPKFTLEEGVRETVEWLRMTNNFYK